VLRMAQSFLKDPESIQLTSNVKKHEQISQRIHWADDATHKHHLLAHYVKTEDVTQAVIFTATKRGADALVSHLQRQGNEVAVLHGDLKPRARKPWIKCTMARSSYWWRRTSLLVVWISRI
ncbi:MAG: hypothetical protein ACPHRA_03655, partial [Limisphaerales bacterium]